LSFSLIPPKLGMGEAPPRVPNECRKAVRGVCASRSGDMTEARAGERVTCPYFEGTFCGERSIAALAASGEACTVHLGDADARRSGEAAGRLKGEAGYSA